MRIAKNLLATVAALAATTALFASEGEGVSPAAAKLVDFGNGWVITNSMATGWAISAEHSDYKQKPGNHGFDPYAPEMAAVFVAHGPAFKHGVVLPTFDNVDVYPLLAALIGVKPQPNDGNLADLAAGLAR